MLTPFQRSQQLCKHMFLVNIFAKTKIFCENVFACSYGAQEEFFDKHKFHKSSDTVSLIYTVKKLSIKTFFSLLKRFHSTGTLKGFSLSIETK